MEVVYSVLPTIPQSDYSTVNAPLSGVAAVLDLQQVLGKKGAEVAGEMLMSTIRSRAKSIVELKGGSISFISN